MTSSIPRRGVVLRAVVESADRSRDGSLPLHVPGVHETFGDALTLVGALQLRWHTRLASRIEAAHQTEPLALDEAVIAAWCEAADNDPGVRAILDRHLAVPTSPEMGEALAKAVAKERAMLAVAAGLCAYGDAAAPVLGATLEQRARDAHRASGAGAAPTRGASTGWLRDLLREAFAA